jgi:hypothetical protein
VIIAVLRTDKLVECAYSFVSDHVGYKFVEPVLVTSPEFLPIFLKSRTADFGPRFKAAAVSFIGLEV